jgi:ABC-type dipeptide/oligopeptide/nickel transport system permease component
VHRRLLVIHRIIAAVLRLLAIFGFVSFCSYMTISRPVLRTIYDAIADYAHFIGNLARFWQSAGDFVLDAYLHSIVAVLIAICLALLVGVPLGFLAGTTQFNSVSTAIRIFSAVGTLTPSFMLALFILIFFVMYVLPMTGIRFVLVTPQATEFDPRRLLPITLTLAARPLAHIVTVVAASSNSGIISNYSVAARAKGLSRGQILHKHVWPNVLPDLVNTIPACFIFCISSLPVVEFIFSWPGVGLRLLFGFGATTLPRTDLSRAALVSFLFTTVGATYLLLVLAVEALQRRVNPLVRDLGH